jgi:hypothetical protein
MMGKQEPLTHAFVSPQAVASGRYPDPSALQVEIALLLHSTLQGVQMRVRQTAEVPVSSQYSLAVQVS